MADLTFPQGGPNKECREEKEDAGEHRLELTG